MWSRDNLSNCFVHLECRRREGKWIIVCNIVLDRSKNFEPTDMGVFTTHVVCYNNDLQYVGMDRFAGEQQPK
jgi:hypothetical protein